MSPMKSHLHQRRILIAYTAFYLTYAAASARAILTLWNDPGFGILIGLLAVYLASMLAEPFLIHRSLSWLHVFNALQAGIALFLLLFVGRLDYFSLLFIPVCAQSVLNLPLKKALVWIGAICLAMEIALLARFPLDESAGYVIIYPTAIFLFTGLCYLALEAEKAQNRSEALLADLQIANRKLQDYAAQVEALAAANERNRLARELHDSVTQIIFGLTLSAQAARILLDRDPGRVAGQLDHIQGLAQNALAEMRSLIQQLHPNPASGDDLVTRLRRLAVERQSADGLVVEITIQGERPLPANITNELFRIVQEALNNIVKHAHTDHAVISLELDQGNRVALSIEDHGIGFDPHKINAMPGHLGLTSISERVQALGGQLRVNSQPGKGTRLEVKFPLEQETEHAI